MEAKTHTFVAGSKLEKIWTAFRLIRKAEGISRVAIKKLAKGAKMDYLSLMAFIEENPDLFSGRLYQIGTKPLGYFVEEVYSSAEQKPGTDEWLAKTKYDNMKYLEISDYNNYGHVSGHYISIHPEDLDSKLMKHLWCNTEQKVMKIASRFDLKEAGYMIGGLGDSSYVRPGGYEISEKLIEQLRQEGWTFNKFEPVSKY